MSVLRQRQFIARFARLVNTTDADGREHAPAGSPDGGQFVGKEGGVKLTITPVTYTVSEFPKFGPDGNVIEGQIGNLPVTTRERGIIQKMTAKTKAALETSLSKPEVKASIERAGIQNIRVDATKGANKPDNWTAGMGQDKALIIHPRTQEYIEKSTIEDRRSGGLDRVIHHEAGHAVWNEASEDHRKEFTEAIAKHPEVSERIGKTVNLKTPPNAFDETKNRVASETHAELQAMRIGKHPEYAGFHPDVKAAAEKIWNTRQPRYSDMHPVKSSLANTRRSLAILANAFVESDHPRDEAGKFTEARTFVKAPSRFFSSNEEKQGFSLIPGRILRPETAADAEKALDRDDNGDGTIPSPFPTVPFNEAETAQWMDRRNEAIPARVNLNKLFGTQRTADTDNVRGFLENPEVRLTLPQGKGYDETPDEQDYLPFVVRNKSGKLQIIDGHHRLTAEHYRGAKTGNVILLDLKRQPILTNDRRRSLAILANSLTPFAGEPQASLAPEAQARKVPMPTAETHKQIMARLTPQARARALWSAQTTNAAYLDQIGGQVQDLIAGKTSYATAKLELKKFGEGLVDDNLLTDARTNLVLNTQVGLAKGYATHVRRLQPMEVYAFPALQLTRRGAPMVPRDWQDIWEQAGAMCDPEGRNDDLLMAVKGHEIWSLLGSNQILDDKGQPRTDGLDVDFPPWRFNSLMGVRDVSRAQAIDAGLIAPDELVDAEQPEDFNDGLSQELDYSVPGLAEMVADLIDGASLVGNLLKLVAQ